LSNKIRAGYEHRTVEVEITYHHPSKNVKTCVRQDTGETWVEDMVAKDHNLFNQYMEEKEKQAEEQTQQELPFAEHGDDAADFDDLPDLPM